MTDLHGMQWMHIVAHTRGGFDEVAGWESASWLWPRVRGVFPDAVAGALMPDHGHTLAPCDEVRLCELRRVLQHHSRRFGTRWDLAPPQAVMSGAIARRTARYIVLNPVRAGLVRDPLRWPWSTLRDALGLIHDPWGQGARLLGLAPAQYWRYVVRDETCAPQARAALQNPQTCIAASFDALAEACASALRCRPEDRRRRRHPCRATFVGLAFDVGRPRPAELAADCHVSRRAIPALRRRADPAAVARARRCLADPRLHIWDTPT